MNEKTLMKIARLPLQNRITYLNQRDDNGCSTLMYAIKFHIKIVAALLLDISIQIKIDSLKIKNNYGMTALMISVMRQPDILNVCANTNFAKDHY